MNDPKWPKLKRDYAGRHVMLDVDIVRSDGVEFPAGEVMLVEKWYRGLSLRTHRRCKECGRRYRESVTRVPQSAVSLLPESWSGSIWQGDHCPGLSEHLMNGIAQTIAEMFHFFYEEMAPDFGYETREDTKEFDPESPNGRLMIAVCRKLVDMEVVK